MLSLMPLSAGSLLLSRKSGVWDRGVGPLLLIEPGMFCGTSNLYGASCLFRVSCSHLKLYWSLSGTWFEQQYRAVVLTYNDAYIIKMLMQRIPLRLTHRLRCDDTVSQ